MFDRPALFTKEVISRLSCKRYLLEMLCQPTMQRAIGVEFILNTVAPKSLFPRCTSQLTRDINSSNAWSARANPVQIWNQNKNASTFTVDAGVCTVITILKTTHAQRSLISTFSMRRVLEHQRGCYFHAHWKTWIWLKMGVSESRLLSFLWT